MDTRIDITRNQNGGSNDQIEFTDQRGKHQVNPCLFNAIVKRVRKHKSKIPPLMNQIIYFVEKKLSFNRSLKFRDSK